MQFLLAFLWQTCLMWAAGQQALRWQLRQGERGHLEAVGPMSQVFGTEIAGFLCKYTPKAQPPLERRECTGQTVSLRASETSPNELQTSYLPEIP